MAETELNLIEEIKDDRTINSGAMSELITSTPKLTTGRAQIPTEEDIPEGSLLKSIFLRDTTIGSMISSVDKGSFSGVEGEDRENFIKFVPERYLDRFDAYALTTSQQEANVVTAALDEEMENTIRVAESPVKSFFYNFAVQPLDPLNYLPGGTIFNNFKKMSLVAKSAASAAASGIVSTAIQETIIQSNQFSREMEESVANTLAAGIFSGAIGGAVGAYGPKLNRFTQQSKDFAKKEILNVITDTAQKLSKDGVVDPNNPIFPEFVKKGMITSLRNRMMKSEFSASKQVANEIYAADWVVAKNQDGVATKNVERMVSLDINEKTSSLIDYQDTFFKQAGVERGFMAARKAERAALEDPTGKIMNWDTWDRAVGEYLHKTEKHQNASVNEGVRIIRENVFDPFKERAIKNDMLPDGVTPANADSYFPQWWDKEKVTRDQAGFFKDTLDGFTEVNNVNKEIRKTKEYKQLTGEIKKLKENIKRSKKTGSKEETKLLEKSLTEKEKALNDSVRNLASTRLDKNEVSALFHTKGQRKGKLRKVSTQAELETSVEQTMDRILGRATSKINTVAISDLDGKAKPLKDRAFLLSQERMWKWMNQSASDVAGRYIHSMAPATRMAEMAKELGFSSIKEWRDSRVKSLTAEFKESNKGLSGEKAVALDKKLKQQTQNITDSFKLILGVYGDGPNVHDGSYAKFYKAMLNWNYIRLLGFMTLSSIPDVGLHVFTHGPFATMYHGIRPVAKQMFGTLKSFSKDDLNAIGVSMNTVLGSRLKAIAGHEQGSASSLFGRTLDKAVQGFGNLTLMNQWNDMQQMIAGTMSVNRTLKTIESITSGKRTTSIDRERIARLGISKEEMPLIRDMWEKAGRAEEGGTYFADWVNWEVKTEAQAKALESFKAATLQEIDQVVIVPGLADKPLAAQTGLGKLLLQFKSFTFAATNKITFAGIQRANDLNIYSGMATMLGLGVLSYITTQAVRGNEDIDLSFETLSSEAFDRSGLLGVISEVYNLQNKAGLGFGAPTSRFQSRGIWGTLLGPSTGLVEDFLTVVNTIRKADGENPLTTKDLEKLLRLAPYQNLFYTYWLSRKVVNDAGPKLGFSREEKNQFKDLFK